VAKSGCLGRKLEKEARPRLGRRACACRRACVRALGPGLQLALVVVGDQALDVRQLAVQVLAAPLLPAVVRVGLRGGGSARSRVHPAPHTSPAPRGPRTAHREPPAWPATHLFDFSVFLQNLPTRGLWRQTQPLTVPPWRRTRLRLSTVPGRSTVATGRSREDRRGTRSSRP
jgi:hypothetical protein